MIDRFGIKNITDYNIQKILYTASKSNHTIQIIMKKKIIHPPKPQDQQDINENDNDSDSIYDQIDINN